MTDTSQRDSSLAIQLGTQGEIQLSLVRLEAHEMLSRHFVVSVEALALADVNLLDNLGKPAAIVCKLEGEVVRRYHGIVAEANFVEEKSNGQLLYRLTLVPALHFFEHGSNYRIFQDESVIEIVKEILDANKIDYKVRATGGSRVLPYCVQYGESDFDFISRLLEEYGMYYFYDHLEDKHLMCICDAPTQHEDMTPGSLVYMPTTGSVDIADSQDDLLGTKDTFVRTWQEHASTGAEFKAVMRDYDFKHPHPEVESENAFPAAHPKDADEVYQWPGRFYEKRDGDSLVKILIESRRAQRLRYEGTSNYSGIACGRTFKLTDHPASNRFNRKYLIIGCRSVLADETYRSGEDAIDTYVDFTAIPDDVQFRAPIETPRPVVRGPETAFVTGPRSEEIHVDEWGRVKVRFHWDRRNLPNADTSSCWIRVAQLSLLGTIVNPRVGQEVIVNFINGNPDRPMVTGFVYNDERKPLYDLPQHKTRSAWRTKTYMEDSGRSHPGAKELDSGRPGANEIRFEDLPGEEEFYQHAEKDMNTRIRNDETHKVGKDVEVYVGNDRKTDIEHNDTLHVGNILKIEVDNEIQMSATNKITITCGESKITMTPTDIKIESINITVDGKMMTTVKAGVQGEFNGGGLTLVKGGMVMIN